MKRLMALTLALLMVLSLVACGGDKPTSTPNQPSTPSNPTTSTPASTNPTEPTKPADPKVEYKKEIIVTAGTAAFESVDPQAKSSFQNTRHYQMTHERLTYLNPITSELQPMLATEWSASADGLTWTFKLREDVTFHNGEKFTAEDVVFTWERGKESTNSSVKSNYNMVTSCVADGDYTVKMTLETPNADFPFTRSFPYMAVLNREAVAADAEKGVMVGTGLWKWGEHVQNDHDTFVRNDAYWGESTPTEKLTIQHIPETASRTVAAETGEVDMAYSVSTKSLDDIRENPDLDLVEVDTISLQYYAWNMGRQGPWQDANFRKAVAHSIDWDSVIIGWKNGFAQRATSFWSHAQYGYAPQKGYDYSVDTAKELLAKSTYKGEDIEILAFPGWSTCALIMSDMLAKVGIKSHVNDVNSATYTTLAADGEYDMTCYQFSFTAPGSDFTRFLAGSQGNRAHVGAPNAAKIDELCAKALQETDDAKRKAMYAEVQKLVEDDAVMVPILYGKSFNAVSKGLEGIVWAPNTDNDYRYARLPISK